MSAAAGDLGSELTVLDVGLGWLCEVGVLTPRWGCSLCLGSM